MSDLETELEFQIRAYQLQAAVREFRFHPERRWRFDFCWPLKKVALEVEGGIWIQGRHSRGGKAFIADCDKYNSATLAGWRVFRVTREHIKSGEAVEIVKRALAN